MVTISGISLLHPEFKLSNTFIYRVEIIQKETVAGSDAVVRLKYSKVICSPIKSYVAKVCKGRNSLI